MRAGPTPDVELLLLLTCGEAGGEGCLPLMTEREGEGGMGVGSGGGARRRPALCDTLNSSSKITKAISKLSSPTKESEIKGKREGRTE